MGIPEGAKLRQMAEALTLEPAVEHGGKAKRTPIQRTLQTIVGKLRWYEKCDPELTKTLHCVSSVATRPPPEALLVAKALLASAGDLAKQLDVEVRSGEHLLLVLLRAHLVEVADVEQVGEPDEEREEDEESESDETDEAEQEAGETVQE